MLDGYNNKTYVNGQVGSVYKQHIPLANASRKPGEWQAYDIVWTAPRFNDDGSLKTAARITAIHNGVLVQNNVEIKGETTYQRKSIVTKSMDLLLSCCKIMAIQVNRSATEISG